MHDHGTESHAHVLFHVTRGNTSGTCIETRFNLFQSVSSQTNTHYSYIVPLVSVCSSQHGLKQIKLCFNAHAGCEAALRSDGSLCLQSYYMNLDVIYHKPFRVITNVHITFKICVILIIIGRALPVGQLFPFNIIIICYFSEC